jgi:hypothetical protein
LPVLAEFRAWLESAQRDVLPKRPVGQAIRYVLPRWDGLTRYCHDGALAIDNNVAERTVRLCAIGRTDLPGERQRRPHRRDLVQLHRHVQG